jgi:hypothetical protein
MKTRRNAKIVNLKREEESWRGERSSELEK